METKTIANRGFWKSELSSQVKRGRAGKKA